MISWDGERDTGVPPPDADNKQLEVFEMKKDFPLGQKVRFCSVNAKVEHGAMISSANEPKAKEKGHFHKVEVPYKHTPLSIFANFMGGDDVENLANGWGDGGLQVRYET